MIIDASQSDRTDGPYQPRTVRLALWEKVSPLQPHETLQISGVCDAQGRDYDLRKAQVNVAQISASLGWKTFTERKADGLTVYRWS